MEIFNKDFIGKVRKFYNNCFQNWICFVVDYFQLSRLSLFQLCLIMKIFKIVK